MSTRRAHDESGAALILAIAFLVVIGGIVAATLASMTSGLNDRAVLDGARDREYAADGAIQYAIAQVRTLPAPGPALTGCGTPAYHALDGVQIRVDCANVPTETFSGYLQRNVIFSACVVASPDVACGGPTTPVVVRAQVDFEATGSGATVNVTGTWIQSWSVMS